MPNHSSFRPKPLLFAGVLLSSLTLCSAQTQPAAPAHKPAAKKPAATASQPAAKAAPAAITTPKDKLSYSIGVDIGSKLRSQSIDVDPEIVEHGLKDALAADKLQMPEDEIRAALTDLNNQLRQKQISAAKEAGDKNKKEGSEFLAENKGKDGVITLPSGLQYKVLKAGEGKKPAATDTVVCQYRGTLISGKEFDSSYKRGQPATFQVNGVIKGWTEALQLMPVGSKWELFIPSEMAYGERGAGADIGPNATLIFEVELVSIQDKEQAK
jgi:FKBP-type peptidyl-prolyl cis-trans isomerase FklB